MRISERLLTVLVLCLLVAAVPAFAGGNGERELKQAQNLVEQKQYSTALEQIVKIMKDYPDLREEADKLVARIMDVRRQFNEKYSALVEILGKNVVEERDVEKGLAIVEELRNLDPNPDPAVDASIRLAERKLQEQGQFRFFGNIMRKAAGELADGKYTEAIVDLPRWIRRVPGRLRRGESPPAAERASPERRSSARDGFETGCGSPGREVGPPE